MSMVVASGGFGWCRNPATLPEVRDFSSSQTTPRHPTLGSGSGCTQYKWGAHCIHSGGYRVLGRDSSLGGATSLGGKAKRLAPRAGLLRAADPSEADPLHSSRRLLFCNLCTIDNYLFSSYKATYDLYSIGPDRFGCDSLSLDTAIMVNYPHITVIKCRLGNNETY